MAINLSLELETFGREPLDLNDIMICIVFIMFRGNICHWLRERRIGDCRWFGLLAGKSNIPHDSRRSGAIGSFLHAHHIVWFQHGGSTSWLAQFNPHFALKLHPSITSSSTLHTTLLATFILQHHLPQVYLNMQYLIGGAAALLLTPLALGKSAGQLCRGTAEESDDGNWYCSEVKAITYRNISQSGLYNRTTQVDPDTGRCVHETVAYDGTGPLTPLFGEVL